MLKDLINDLTTEGYILSVKSGSHENTLTSRLYYSTNRKKLEKICKILQFENNQLTFRYREQKYEIRRYLKFYTDKFGHDEGISKEDFDKFLLNNPIPSYITEFIKAYKMPEEYDKNGESQYHIEETIDWEYDIDKFYHVSKLHGNKDELKKILDNLNIEKFNQVMNKKKTIKLKIEPHFIPDPVSELPPEQSLDSSVPELEKDIDW